MRIFVIGDIHGAYKALTQCLARSAFEQKKDRLIVLGDVCDGYPQVKECIEELLKIEHRDYIIGNHDLWALDWATRGIKERIWLTQGGENTVASYGPGGMPQTHIDFLKKAKWYVEFEQRLFVHGGFDPRKLIAKQDLETLVWDRELIREAWERHLFGEEFSYGGYKEIYLGHTPTALFSSDIPIKLGNIWAVDTGAGWSGKLTIMDTETKQYWQSDLTPTLYPGIVGRGKLKN